MTTPAHIERDSQSPADRFETVLPDIVPLKGHAARETQALTFAHARLMMSLRFAHPNDAGNSRRTDA